MRPRKHSCAWRLYLPEAWANDLVRRRAAGVPDEIQFATKPQIALSQLRALLADGAPHHCVLADAGYGVDTDFRQALSDMGLVYAVGVTSAVSVWPPGVEPLPPQALQRHRPSAGDAPAHRSAATAYFSPSWTAFQADRGRGFSVIVDGVSD